jgi:FkbH-like protein
MVPFSAFTRIQPRQFTLLLKLLCLETHVLIELSWLPIAAEWATFASAAAKQPDETTRWQHLVACAHHRIDFLETAKLDRLLQKAFPTGAPAVAGKPLRLALLGSSTLKHLVPAIRIGALRRGLWVEIFEGEYGQYRQELMDAGSPLAAFQPDVVLLALDAHHVASGSAEAALENVTACWAAARENFGATVIQQTVLPVFERLLGNNEQREAQSPAAIIEKINTRLRDLADESGVHLLAADSYAAEYGSREWFDPVLWHRSKQEIHPRVSHFYGDLAGRLLAALRGRSSKCLVLDLDNTLWGGVIGDDGLEGIQLGQGSAMGEAFVAFQEYAQRLARRGVILAVCSKNDEANALAAFEKHPDMVLRRKDIACFVANWQDKASNLRHIAKTLNIGIDSLVFADDNPFERNLVRQELPEVQVPELPEDPSFYASTIAEAGYFESLAVTDEDRERTGQYRANIERDELKASATDMDGYLRGLGMELIVRPFDGIGLSRIIQLINKTNQFNLTTRRYTEADIRAVMSDPKVVTYQLRLTDRFGDNGIIAILIGRIDHGALVLDTWLMSCRVLGRQVEEACLNVMVDAARTLGAERIVGDYIPTAKNGMVAELYPRLGFTLVSSGETGTRWELALDGYEKKPVIMQVSITS